MLSIALIRYVPGALEVPQPWNGESMTNKSANCLIFDFRLSQVGTEESNRCWFEGVKTLSQNEVKVNPNRVKVT